MKTFKMNDYEKYERDCKKIRKANKGLLDEFEASLKAAGLSEKTINNHLGNLDFYSTIKFFLLDRIYWTFHETPFASHFSKFSNLVVTVKFTEKSSSCSACFINILESWDINSQLLKT